MSKETDWYRMHELEAIIAESITKLRDIKARNPEFKNAIRNDPASILNGYRDGDVTFTEAREHLLRMIEAAAIPTKQ